MAQPKRALQVGDLFELTVDDGCFGYGVITKPGVVFSVLILSKIYIGRPDINELLADDSGLIGATTDSFFHHDRWNLIAHDFLIPVNIPYPNWKIGTAQELRVTDYDGKQTWPIRPHEVDLLDYKFNVSPLHFHKALQALNGIGEWNAEYEKLTCEYARRRVTRI
ncbi:hypothetical protein OVA03_15915 [Asticcacaulis sp. SL142]|uniref:hypothetical protein n=1 Tax=Asticcacaulis sp. SL142 TaxID=2995155 RepID=UPI00226C8BE0|nr:hypothetical protein [Asticcacaulis sp. SL142]WAC48159.1 hypothetical protein OVA03_15915 [Asticcacaulis sp. SL142]